MDPPKLTNLRETGTSSSDVTLSMSPSNEDPCFGFESCIKVDGRSILPPMMTEARREEMRRYQEVAVSREQVRRRRRVAETRVNLHSDSSEIEHGEPIQSPVVTTMPEKAPSTNVVSSTPYGVPRAPSVVSNEPNVVSSVPNVVSNKSIVASSLPSMVSNTSTMVSNTSTMVSNTPNVGSNTPTVVSNTSTMVSNTPNVGSNTSTVVSNTSTMVSNTPNVGSSAPNVQRIANEEKLDDSFRFIPTSTVPKPRKQYFEDVPTAATSTSTSQTGIIPQQPTTRLQSEPKPEVVAPVAAPHSLPSQLESEEEDDTFSQSSYESVTSVLSSATFIVENSESFAALNNTISEGELLDDFDLDELDEAANLVTRKLKINPDEENSGQTDTALSQASELQKDDTLSTTSNFTTATAISVPSVMSCGFENLGLARFKERMKLMSPSMLKILPGETRSPLMKGVVFMNPLSRPRVIKKLPLEIFDPNMKRKFDRVSAQVKGYLTRRLFQTAKVAFLVDAVEESTALIENLQAEGRRRAKGSKDGYVLAEDMELYNRLMQQIYGAVEAVHDIFFKITIKEQMAIISTDRIMMMNRNHRLAEGSGFGRTNLSNATLRSMERRSVQALEPPIPKRPKYQAVKEKRPLQVPSHVIPPSSSIPIPDNQNVKPKARKGLLVTPKRRRVSMSVSTKPTTPYNSRLGVGSISGMTAASRLSVMDKVKSSSNPNISVSSRQSFNSRLVTGAKGKTDTQNRGKKMEPQFLKPKATPLVSSNRR